MPVTLYALPAYGRGASRADWYAGKDFKFHAGPYFSIRDVERLKADGYTHVAVWDSKIRNYAFTINLYED